MKFNHYIVGALPKLTWDSELPSTLYEFLEDNWLVFQTLKDGISDILLLNDVKNVELILKEQMPAPEGMQGNRGDKIDFYRARLVEPEELEYFLEDPFINAPDNYPEFMVDYFDQYKSVEERVDHIEELYIAYFRYVQERESGFFKYYGRIATVIRTVLAALRILRLGLDLEKHLTGDPYIVQTILENRTQSDLGLKTIFPEIPDVIALFDMEPLDLEHHLDKIRFKLMEEVGRETPFGDHIIYSYIIGFQLRNRWNTLDGAEGDKILMDIING